MSAEGKKSFLAVECPQMGWQPVQIVSLPSPGLFKQRFFPWWSLRAAPCLYLEFPCFLFRPACSPPREKGT